MSDCHEAEPGSDGLLCPSESLWDRLACRIEMETSLRPLPAPTLQWSEPQWEEVAPGTSCKRLAVDVENGRLTLLVRVAPAVPLPQCMQQAMEELYLLHGELWINGRKLCPGEYNHTEPGDAHPRLWSETGCTCLLIAVFSRVAPRPSDGPGRCAEPGAAPPMRGADRRSRAREE